jgi:hypothetical protein
MAEVHVHNILQTITDLVKPVLRGHIWDDEKVAS